MSLLEKKLKSKTVNFQYVNQNFFKVKHEGDKRLFDHLYDNFAVYVQGYRFMPSFQAGIWDGRIKYFDKLRQQLPIGLVKEAYEFIGKFHKDKRVIIDRELKECLFNQKFKNVETEEFKLNLEPRPYQESAIKKALFHRRAVIKSPTASGKSYIIGCLIDYLYKEKEVYNWLIIVPTIQLVEQMKSDLMDYGISKKKIGIIHGGTKKEEEFMRNYVISTWQSLCVKKGKTYKWTHVMKEFEGVIVDECHLSKAQEIKGIVKHCTNSKYRLGLTGTLPDSDADLYGVLAYLGPKVLDIQTKQLIEQGYVSDLKIICLHIEYEDKEKFSQPDLLWIDVKQMIMKEKRRLKLLENICKSTTKNILMLVSFVDTEGKILEEYLKEKIPNKEIHFIHGSVPVLEREKIRKSAENKNDMILIATYGTFKLGLNIKNLHFIVLASPLAGKIPNLQSIGRGLRVLPGKKLTVYDPIDHVKFLGSHGKRRAKVWKKEKFSVKNFKVPNDY